MFITFEGIDGCGKTVQAKMLQAVVEKSVYVREPSGIVGDAVRALVNEKIDIKTELLLMMAARNESMHELQQHSIANIHIICDRYIDSTYVYQSGPGFSKKNTEMIDTLHKFVSSPMLVVPDFTILLDVDANIAQDRKRRQHLKEKNKLTRLDDLDSWTVKGMRNKYLDIAKANSDRFIVIEGAGHKKTIHRAIVEELNARFPLLIRK